LGRNGAENCEHPLWKLLKESFLARDHRKKAVFKDVFSPSSSGAPVARSFEKKMREIEILIRLGLCASGLQSPDLHRLMSKILNANELDR
jgi:hypothetical protein